MSDTAAGADLVSDDDFLGIPDGNPEQNPRGEPQLVTVPDGTRADRLDKVLAGLMPDHSRSRLQGWIEAGNVHVNGAFNCARAVLPAMIAQGGGRIIITSSVAALACMPGIAAYSAAKGALAAFTRALAVEYGGQGVTCNALAPGFVRTGFPTAPQEREQFNDPLGRWADPEDISPAVIYLASQAGRFVNGHVLAIDGGLLAHL